MKANIDHWRETAITEQLPMEHRRRDTGANVQDMDEIDAVMAFI